MKISIITVCKNPGDAIKRTIDSVLSQTYRNIEYIVVDGNSVDKTLEIIRCFVTESERLEVRGETTFDDPNISSNVSRLTFNYISELDSGIYNAMNKGISLATGDIIYFLNAGDRLFNEGVIESVVNEFVKGGADFIYTDIFCEDGGAGYIKKFDIVDRYFLIRDCISHQASFYRKDIFEKLGNFNENLKIASDYELLLKIMKEGSLNKRYLSIISAYYDTKGISSTNRELLENERSEIIKRNFSFFERFVLNSFLYRFFRKFSATLKYFLNQYRGGNG